MMGAISLESTRAYTESALPQPLAVVARRYRIMPTEDLGGRHKALVDLFEVLVKFMCIVQLQEASRRTRESCFSNIVCEGKESCPKRVNPFYLS